MEPISLTEDQLRALYNVRLVVLVEEHPQSNRYLQFKFTKEQFDIISDTLSSLYPIENTKGNTEIRKFSFVDKIVVLPEHIQDFYEDNKEKKNIS